MKRALMALTVLALLGLFLCPASATPAVVDNSWRVLMQFGDSQFIVPDGTYLWELENVSGGYNIILGTGEKPSNPGYITFTNADGLITTLVITDVTSFSAPWLLQPFTAKVRNIRLLGADDILSQRWAPRMTLGDPEQILTDGVYWLQVRNLGGPFSITLGRGSDLSQSGLVVLWDSQSQPIPIIVDDATQVAIPFMISDHGFFMETQNVRLLSVDDSLWQPAAAYNIFFPIIYH